jgi:hypothetical protein
MARIQLVMPDEDRDRFVHEARKEGISLSEWLRLAARERVERSHRLARFATAEELAGFFERCDQSAEPGVEPDWEDHLEVIRGSRERGVSGT